MVNMLHRKKRVNDGFSVSKLEISMLQTRNTARKKYEDVELQALLDEDDSQKQLAEQLSVSQQAVSNRLGEGRFRKLADECHMNWTKDRWRGAKTHVTFCSNTIQKKVILASYRYWRWKVDFFLESQAQKIMGKPRRTIHIDRKTESLWQEDDALCLVGPEGCGLLWVIEAWRNG